jgi:hypothetical protein
MCADTLSDGPSDDNVGIEILVIMSLKFQGK